VKFGARYTKTMYVIAFLLTENTGECRVAALNLIESKKRIVMSVHKQYAIATMMQTLVRASADKSDRVYQLCARYDAIRYDAKPTSQCSDEN